MGNAANEKCHEAVMATVQNIMLRENPYVAAYKHMAQVEEELSARGDTSWVTMHMRRNKDSDLRRYNLPSHEEVAAVFTGSDGAPPSPQSRDVVVYPRNQHLRKISILSHALDPMTYPIFFPRGDPGWDTEMLHNPARRSKKRIRLTMREFYNHRFAVRPSFSPIHHGRKLFQQYAVDAYCKIEGQRLDFIRGNQDELRVESYKGLLDHLNSVADASGRQVGSCVILPSTFPGSPRAMVQISKILWL